MRRSFTKLVICLLSWIVIHDSTSSLSAFDLWKYQPSPSNQQIAKWKAQYFETEFEVWSFDSHDDVQRFVDKHVTDERLKDIFFQRLTTEIPEAKRCKFPGNALQLSHSHHVILNRFDQLLLNTSLRASYYLQAYSSWDLLPPVHIAYRSFEDAKQKWKEAGADEAVLVRLEEELLYMKGYYVFPVDHWTWPIIPDAVKTWLIKVNASGTGIQASHRMILPMKSPFANTMVNTFRDEHGANCLNTAMNYALLPPYRIEYTTEEEFKKYLESRYEEVEVSEALNEGDLIVYYDRKDKMVHASVSLGGAYVFVKNGFLRENPYVVQFRSENEKVIQGMFVKSRLFRSKSQ